MTQQLQVQFELPGYLRNRLPILTAIVSLCIALIAIASAAFFIKLGEQEISPYATAFNRFWLTTLILSVWNGFKAFIPSREEETLLEPPAADSSYTVAVIAQLVLVGMFLSADLMLWAWSLTQTSVANATLFANLTPVFTCVAGWLLWGHRFDRQFLLGLFIALIGIATIGFGDFHISFGKMQGDIAALLAAASFSVYLLFLERLQKHLKSTTISFWTSAFATLSCLPIVLIDSQPVFPSSGQGWLTVIGLAVICQLVGQGLLIYSLKQLSAEFVAIFLLLEPVLAAIGAWALFSEHLSWLNLIAFAIVITGIYLALSSPSSCYNETEPCEIPPLQNG